MRPTKQVWLPKVGHWAHFHDRKQMRSSVRPIPLVGRTPFTPPATILPVDSTGNGAVSCPIDGNDQYGDCGEAMIAHIDNILTFGRGLPGWTQSTFDPNVLVQQYLAEAGGDYGLYEEQVLEIWKSGIGGIPAATVVDSFDFDVTNISLAQYLIDNFFAVSMGWSVPDEFINDWQSGTIWPDAMRPDSSNGHYSVLADVGGPPTPANTVNLAGFYRLYTWGGWSWVSPDFVGSVEPECFVGFSPRQFSPSTGRDAKGRHITTQANLWAQAGGNPIPASVLAAFPAA